MAPPVPLPLSAASSARPRAVHLSIVPPAPARPDAPGPEQLAAWLHAVAQTQDREAFGRLFAHFAPRIKSYLLRGGTPDDVAEDLAQETLVMLWRKAALFDGRQAGVSTWVFTIARNLRVDRFRRVGAQPEHEACDFDLDTLVQDGPAPDERLHAEREQTRLRAALRGLPPEQAEVLRLSYYEEQPHARIAQLLDIPLGTVKSRVRLAVVNLRRLLDVLEGSQR
ncbi:MAG: sigma-70 family RNA polymerase sigma factor [Comamonadaceae bacterium]|nr:MAG: sigma-70 family RNA polymerase sigma factor [Comamonadaceae bacterium]